MSRRTRDTWTPSTSRDNSSSGNYTGWNRRDIRGANSSGYEDKHATWGGTGGYESDKNKDSASRKGDEREAEKEKEREKEKGRDKPREKFNITKEDMWTLQRVLDSRKCSLGSTYKKNSEANNKVYDLNHNTMAALDRLTDAYETFEDTWAFVEKEPAEGDLLLAEEEEAIDQFEAARQHKARVLDEVENSR